jgi:hypothetical protein
VVLTALAAGCDGTPDAPTGNTDSGAGPAVDAGIDAGIDAGPALHASTPTIVRFEVKQVCVQGSRPEDGLSVSTFLEVIDDQGSSPWQYRITEYRNPDGGPGLVEMTSPSFPPGNYSFPRDLVPGLPISTTSTSPSFSFDLPFLAETYVLPPDGGQIFSGSKAAFIEPPDGGCP